LLQRDNS